MRCSDDDKCGDSAATERWFVLLGHFFFYTIHRDSPEYSGALLANIFGPVVIPSAGGKAAGKPPNTPSSRAEAKVGCVIIRKLALCA